MLAGINLLEFAQYHRFGHVFGGVAAHALHKFVLFFGEIYPINHLHPCSVVVLLQLGDAFCEFCLLYTSPSPRDVEESRMPSSA